MSNTVFTFDINTTDAEAQLGIEVRLDDQLIYSNLHVKELHRLKHELSDDDGVHKLCITMLGKTADHTRIDVNGDILKDAMLELSNFTIDDIDVKQVWIEKASYTHDFNGTQSQIEDEFYGCMGCNGTVSLVFSTPIYLWLLENM